MINSLALEDFQASFLCVQNVLTTPIATADPGIRKRGGKCFGTNSEGPTFRGVNTIWSSLKVPFVIRRLVNF